MGEPTRWESALQLIVDVLRTNGRPSEDYDTDTDSRPGSSCSDGSGGGVTDLDQHIRVFACNADLQFQDRSSIPRLLTNSVNVYCCYIENVSETIRLYSH